MAISPNSLKPTGHYHSYLLRLWQENDNGPWRVSAYCIQTGETVRFTSLEALYAFLDASLADGGGDSGSRTD